MNRAFLLTEMGGRKFAPNTPETAKIKPLDATQEKQLQQMRRQVITCRRKVKELERLAQDAFEDLKSLQIEPMASFDDVDTYETERIKRLEAEKQLAEIKQQLEAAREEYRQVHGEYRKIHNDYGRKYYQAVNERWKQLEELVEQAQAMADEINAFGRHCAQFGDFYAPSLNSKFKYIMAHGSQTIKDGLQTYSV